MGRASSRWMEGWQKICLSAIITSPSADNPTSITVLLFLCETPLGFTPMRTTIMNRSRWLVSPLLLVPPVEMSACDGKTSNPSSLPSHYLSHLHPRQMSEGFPTSPSPRVFSLGSSLDSFLNVYHDHRSSPCIYYNDASIFYTPLQYHSAQRPNIILSLVSSICAACFASRFREHSTKRPSRTSAIELQPCRRRGNHHRCNDPSQPFYENTVMRHMSRATTPATYLRLAHVGDIESKYKGVQCGSR